MTNERGEFELTAQQQRRSMNFALLTTSATIVGAGCIAGNVLNLLCLKLGAGELFLGALSFATAAPMVCRVLTMSAVEKIGKRRVLLLWHSVAIVFVIPFLFLPVLVEHWPARASLALILIATSLRNISNSLGTTGWFPLLQDIVPSEITGRFFARMRSTWQSANLITIIFAAWLLGDEPDWWKFELLFVIALIAYLIRSAAFIPMVEKPPMPDQVRHGSILSRFTEIFSKKQLRPLIVYISFYMFAAAVSEPFKIKLLNDLGYSSGFILAATAMVSVGAIISLRFWGRLADRFGNRAIFSISHIGMIISTALWIMMEKSTFGSVLVFALFLFWSIFNSGNGIAQTRYILHAVPSNKQNDINIIMIISNLTMAVAPLFGGLFLVLTKNYSFDSGALSLNNYHIMFIISAVLFAVPHSLRRGLKLKKETPTTQVLAVVMRPIRNIFGPFVRLRKKPPNQND